MTDVAPEPLPKGADNVIAFPPRTASPIEKYAVLPIARLTIGDDFRLDDDVGDLNELAESISELGVLLPLRVRPKGGGWEVCAGRRRLAASRIAGLEQVPCCIREMTDEEAADVALAENSHRRNLSPIETAFSYDRLRKQGLTQKEIAKRVSRSDWYVNVMLRLLEMPVGIRRKVHAGTMSYVTAYEHWRRAKTGMRQGGSKVVLTPPNNEATVASHWRRRHDRLITFLHAWDQASPETLPNYREMIRRVLKLDTKPFDLENKPMDA